MSARAKTLPTDFRIDLGYEVIHYQEVPKKVIRRIMASLKEYAAPGTNWRDALASVIENSGGETATVLRGARTREGFTQAELAEKIGVKQSHISEMENGSRPIGKTMAKRLGQALKISYKVFL